MGGGKELRRRVEVFPVIHWSNMLLWLRGMQLIHKVCHSEEKSLSLLLPISPSIPILEKGTSSSAKTRS
ncbi:hypothetical protein CY34DRAFT_813220 [Suillus luteus UH-Slu-Lm8-n1]|uniref:Uncharacterized protein n=1 Tax=Suillus luteus UH-Slu-Lm8-n1 TaxID=930992 RepID=A0A0C9ZXB3_9AGAM|nr:hypothetical protein CY34DRAFT_813220 [Suillus luteus UH-Slu-Lm8-n1]